LFIAELSESAWDKVNNKNNESTKPVSINFDIVVIPLVAVSLAKAERANFSHARTAAVKKIMKNLAARQLVKGGSGSRKTT
jgi:hypothetical protein